MIKAIFWSYFIALSSIQSSLFPLLSHHFLRFFLVGLDTRRAFSKQHGAIGKRWQSLSRAQA